ncbi:glycosyltransferase family 39 protein [Candidatus Gottesmanbacteria bacterium]|nr:glycosyltransferase family 39 protein [Candidatus Gottesmanbacteria bacterium]
MVRTHFFLFLILLLACVLRLYNFPYRYSLGVETVRDAVIGIEGARELQMPLTGSFSSLGPFTFGPLYAYQLIIATLIFRSLYAPWIYLTLISILYVVVIYKIGTLLEGPALGLLVATFAAVSPAQIISATHLTSHNVTNIFTVLAIYIFLKILKEKTSSWWNFLLGLVIGTGMNLHYQMAGLLVLPLLIFVSKPKNYVRLFACGAGVFVTFLPLLFFDLNNHWFNVRNMIYYFRFGKNMIYIPNRWLFYVRDFWPGFWADAFGIPTILAKAIMIIFLIVTAVQVAQKKLSRPYLLLLIALLVNFVLLRYYWGPRFYGYLNFLRPFVFLGTASTFLFLAKNMLGRIAMFLMVVLMLYLAAPRIISELAPDGLSYDMYRQMAEVEKKLGKGRYKTFGCYHSNQARNESKSFSLAFIADLHQQWSGPDKNIGLIANDCTDPTRLTYPPLTDGGIVDLSGASEEKLKRGGWEAITFRGIYDANARWWLKNDL